jgi:hypothetical protein
VVKIRNPRSSAISAGKIFLLPSAAVLTKNLYLGPAMTNVLALSSP